MLPIAKSVKSQIRSTESSHIVKTTIILSHNAVLTNALNPLTYTIIYTVLNKVLYTSLHTVLYTVQNT